MSDEDMNASWKVVGYFIKNKAEELHKTLVENPEIQRQMHHEMMEKVHSLQSGLLGLPYERREFVYRKEWRIADLKRKYLRKRTQRKNRNV